MEAQVKTSIRILRIVVDDKVYTKFFALPKNIFIITTARQYNWYRVIVS